MSLGGKQLQLRTIFRTCQCKGNVLGPAGCFPLLVFISGLFVGLQHVSSGPVRFLTVLLLVFTSLTQRAFSQGPALYAAQAHKCCSLAPHRIPPLLGLQPRLPVRPHRGTQWGLGGPPCRFWVLPVCLPTLWRMGLKDVTQL